MAVYRAYVASDVPVNGEITVTHALTGPSKFSIRLKKRNWEYLRMRSELESCTLRPLPGPPLNGTACIAVKSEKLHRGLVLSCREQQTFLVCLVDIGCLEVLPGNMLFEIPDEMMAYRLFSTRVSLVNGEALSAKPGLNEIFNTLVSSLDPIISEVVKREATHQIVNLFDTKNQSIAKLVLSLYNDLLPKFRAISPTPPTIPKIEILDPPVKLSEKLFVMASHRIGHFYGQLHSHTACELSEIFSDLLKSHDCNPNVQRLDVGSYIGYTAVVKWAQDGQEEQFYRCRILNETGEYAEVSLIDFGDLITVPRRDLFAPIRTGRFLRPAFGIHCVIPCEDGAPLKKEDWDAALMDKSVEVRIGRKNPDGTYTVAFTSDPLNQKIKELLFPPITTEQVENPPAPLSTPFNAAPTSAPAQARPLDKIEEEPTAPKPSPHPVYQHPNNRMSVAATNAILERPAAAPVIQEVLRSPRGPTSTGNGFQRGFATIEPATPPKVADAVLPVAKATPSIRSVPAPTATYAFLPTPQQSVAVAWFYSFDRFYLSPIDLTAYETELESLNEFYAGLSGTELVEDSPKVGLPCVVKFRDDNIFYRSQIVTMFPDKTAQILFVDYGNEQITPLPEIKRIVPKYMKIPQMIWPCKLAGIDGVQQGSEIKLTADDDLVATFLSVDKGVHHVKIMHKIHGDMATYVTKNSLPVLRPAISQLRDPKCQLIPDGYDVYVSYVKSASEFWIQLKADEQIINDIGEELAQYIEKGATKIERPVVGQLYTMELPDVGGFYRARVSSLDGNKVFASFIDYGDAHPVSIEKVFSMPDRLKALPPLALRCSMSRPKWPLEAEKSFVTMTSDLETVFRAVFQSSSYQGIRVVDSLSAAGKNLESEIFAGLKTVSEMDVGTVKVPVPLPPVEIAKEVIAAPLPKNIQVPDSSPDGKKAFPRPAVSDIYDSSINPKIKDSEIYVSYSKSPSEFWVQLKADEDIVQDVTEELTQHMEKTPLKVPRPIIGQIYVVEHPTLGGHFRARVSAIAGDLVEVCFVDYGDVLTVSIEKVFSLSARLSALPPLAACCRMRRQDWSVEAKERFSSLTSNLEAVFRASFGPIVGKCVREVEALFLDGKNVEDNIFPKQNDAGLVEAAAPLPQNLVVKETVAAPLPEKIRVPELAVDAKKAFRRPAISDLCDPSIEMPTKDHEIYVSYSKCPTEFWIQLKADEDIVYSLADELIQHMDTAPLRVARPIVGKIYAMEHPVLGGHYRARVSAFVGDTVEACFVDYGDVLPVPIDKVFTPSARLEVLPPLATCCRMKRQDWSTEAKERFVSITSNLETVFRATFGSIVGKSVREVDALFLDGKNIEDDIFPNQSVELLEARPSSAVLHIDEKSTVEIEDAFPRPAISDLRDPSKNMVTDGYDVYVSYVKSPSEFWIQLKADEDLVIKVTEDLTHEHVKAKLPVVADQLYAVEHPTYGGKFRAQVTLVNAATAQALFVDYGDVHSVPIDSIFVLPEPLKLLPPLSTRCSMKRKEWQLDEQSSFISKTSNVEDVFRATFGPLGEDSVHQVDALLLGGKNIEDDIFHKLKIVQKSELGATEEIKSSVEVEETLARPAIVDLFDPSLKMKTDGYDVYLSFVKSPSEFWIQLKADEEVVNKVGEDLTHGLGKANMPIIVEQLYAVEHPTFGGKFRARITSVNGGTVEAFFVDYGDVHPVPIESIFVLPERLRLLPPLATRCSMKRQQWSLEAATRFVLMTCNSEEVFHVTFEPSGDDAVHRVDVLLLGGKNIEEDIFPKPQNNGLVDGMALAPSTEGKKVVARPVISDLYNSGPLNVKGYQIYISSVNSPSKFYVQMKADEKLIDEISYELAQHVRTSASIVERPVGDQLYVMEHPTLGGFYRVRITPMDGNAVEAFFVEYGETHSVQSPKILTLPEHLKEFPFLAACCSMKRSKWTPEAKDRFVIIASDQATVFRAVFDPAKEDGKLPIVSLFKDETNIEDVIFAGVDGDELTSITAQDPVAIKADPELCSAQEKVQDPVGEKNDSDMCSGLGVVEPEVEQEKDTKSFQEPLKEVITDSNPPLSEEDEVMRSAVSGSRDPKSTLASIGTSIPDEDVTHIDSESPKGLDLDSIKPEKEEVVDKICVLKPEVKEEKQANSIPIGNLVELDDSSQPIHVVTALSGESVPMVDLISAPLEAIPRDNVLTPVIKLTQVGSSTSVNMDTSTEESRVGSVIIDDVLSTSDTMFNDSILAAGSTRISSVIEEKKAVSISIDGDSIPIETPTTTPVEEEDQPASILMEDACVPESPAPTELVAVEDGEASDPAVSKYTVGDDEQPVASVLIEVEELPDPVAAGEAAAPVLKASDHSGANVTAYESKPSSSSGDIETISQLLPEATTDAEVKLNDPAHPALASERTIRNESACSIDPCGEVEEQSACMNFTNNLQLPLPSEEGTILNITELLDMASVHEEAERVDDHLSPVKPSGATSDPADTAPVLLTPQHFTAVFGETPTEKEPSAALVHEEEQILDSDPKIKDQGHQALSSSSIPKRSLLDDTLIDVSVDSLNDIKIVAGANHIQEEELVEKVEDVATETIDTVIEEESHGQCVSTPEGSQLASESGKEEPELVHSELVEDLPPAVTPAGLDGTV